jgi:hypothetical protein
VSILDSSPVMVTEVLRPEANKVDRVPHVGQSSPRNTELRPSPSEECSKDHDNAVP